MTGKKFIQRLLVFVYCLAGCFSPASGQSVSATPEGIDTPPFKIVYHSWNSKDGLPSWKIDAFLHDSRGLMWMNTGMRIFNFDGQTFRQVTTLSNVVQGEKISALAEDLHGNIWIIRHAKEYATIDVLRYDTGELVPLHIYLQVAQPVKIPLQAEALMVHNIQGIIWVGSSRQGFVYDGRWRQLLRRNNSADTDYWYPAKEGFWLVGGPDQDIQFIDNQGQICGTYPIPKQHPWYSLWLDNDLSLWIANTLEGSIEQLEYIQLNTHATTLHNRRTRLLPKIGWCQRKDSWRGRSLLQYGLLLHAEKGDIYLGTPQQPKVANLSKEYPEVAISGNHYIDRQGALWCVSAHALTRLELRQPLPFRRFLTEPNPLHSIRGIAQFRDNLFVNSYSGAKIIHLPTGNLSPFTYPDNYRGLALLADSTGIWAGSHSGILIRQLPSGQQQSFPLTPASVTSCLLKSSSGSLYAGTTNGLYRLDTNADTAVLTSFAGISVHCLHENSRGLWAGTPKGLFLLDESGQIISSHLKPDKKLSYQYISHLYENETGEFWLATMEGGIIHWKPASNTISQYTTLEGLSNDNVHAIYADNRGYLWMPSDYGLMRFHAASRSIRTFFVEDGLADNEFNQMAHFRARNGTMYLGGINGITVFHPHEIAERAQNDYSLHLIEARSFDINKGIFVYQLQNAAQWQEIPMRPTDAYLDLRLSPLLFEEKNQFYYEWKIEGLHHQWIQQSTPDIRLSKLPYGMQELQVRLRRLGNPAAIATLSIPLRIIRPFYLRLPFILIFMGLLAGGALGFSYWRNRQLIRSNLLLEAEVRSRTRQIELDKQLISQQASDLRALDEMKSRFFANVTHELRSPLTLILGPVNHLLGNNTKPEKTYDYLRTIQRNAHKLLNLVDELLDLSKMESNKLVLNEKPALLYPFLNRCLASFRPFAEQQGISLTIDYHCPTDLCIRMDMAKWEKIVNNLLSNALKFTPAGGSVTLFSRLTEELLSIGVSDTGSGIAPEDLPHIFDRYFQTKLPQSGVRGGTGIGLSLCREYARLLGADIYVQSSLGQGTTFTVSFSPKIIRVTVEPVAAFSTVIPASLPTTLAESAPDGQHTLLLVEDDPEMLAYITDILQHDYRLLTAANGQLALQLLATQPIDLVISDVMMPQMDGFQLLEKTKEIHQDLPFIMLTARIGADDRLHALQLGVDDYLTKPFVEAELTARLRNLLARYDARRKIQTAGLTTEMEEIDSTNTTDNQSFDRKWLQLLDSIINDKMSDPHFTIADIAEKMNTSERNMYYKIKSFTGLTPNQYLIEARLLKARFLLENKAFQTVAEVCFAVGFSSTQYFSRIVKNRFGKSPSEFLR